MASTPTSGAPQVPLLRDPRFRSILWQVLLLLVLLGVGAYLVLEAWSNLRRANVASGFGLWNQTAGFDISQTLIEYSSSASTYGRAFWVGLVNTLLVAAIGIVL